MEAKKASKGVLIATSSFSKESRDFVSKVTKRIVLIDGEQLVRYMIENDVGVTRKATYEVKRIDPDYFVEK